jgi:hypothetical protein
MNTQPPPPFNSAWLHTRSGNPTYLARKDPQHRFSPPQKSLDPNTLGIYRYTHPARIHRCPNLRDSTNEQTSRLALCRYAEYPPCTNPPPYTNPYFVPHAELALRLLQAYIRTLRKLTSEYSTSSCDPTSYELPKLRQALYKIP